MIDSLAALLTPEKIMMALVIMNAIAFASFGIDKWKARNARWRISEGTLLQLALLGGTPGAYLGRRVFRHKTRKQPFVRNLHTIAFLQVMGIVGWNAWDLANQFWK
ncbi:MAG: DUF1294 domain-containing protein [Novosphingobium sp.]|uniref:DUF1294 domain-containing protein n=1 Tax=Novosphingobium sp. TaxID=1874826 RepID=UPI002737448F|nr:DUF1294 domain-containing protein [Novosphingobium sp.]MDP3550419.1 DUF1294 domain-containing protein [Novosphingobium sp.]